MDEEETKFQEDPEENGQSFEKTKTGRPRRAAAVRVIDKFKTSIGEICMIPILARSSSKLRNPKERYGWTITTRQKSTLASLRWKKGDQYL